MISADSMSWSYTVRRDRPLPAHRPLHAMVQLTRHAEVPEHQDFETSLSGAHTYARRSATISGLGVAVCTES